MPSRLQIVAGAIIGMVGLLILARLDIPHIEGGGWPAIVAGADLAFFTVLLGASLTVASIYRPDEDERS